MKKPHFSGVAALVVLVCVLSACSLLKGSFGGNKPDIPTGAISPDLDNDLFKDTSCIIRMDADAATATLNGEGVDMNELTDAIKAKLEGKTPDRRVVFIEGARTLRYSTVTSLLRIIRNADVEKVGLVVEKKLERPDSGRYCFHLTLETGGRPGPLKVTKPNPLTLVVALDTALRTTINNEPFGNVSDTLPIVSKLSDIFKQRESNGAFREGTNEIEKTVWIKAPEGVGYGDVVKLIDAVKMSGASPIAVLLDDLPQ